MIQRLALAALLALAPAVALAQPTARGAPPALDEAPPAANPTEALFNAINLGDMDQVRAAVAAGAASAFIPGGAVISAAVTQTAL
ncbi:MAG: hypothetical protein ACK4ST_15115, partial [Elioraea tepidiphila]